jgi:hypothetical protein
VSFSVRIDGLDDVVRDLRRTDRELAKRVKGVTREAGKELLPEVRGAVKGQNVAGTGKAARGVTLSVTRGGAAADIVLKGSSPTIRAVEFGTNVHTVFGRRVLAASMRRRVFRPWVGRGGKPYAVWPAMERNIEPIAQKYIRAINRLLGG